MKPWVWFTIAAVLISIAAILDIDIISRHGDHSFSNTTGRVVYSVASGGDTFGECGKDNPCTRGHAEQLAGADVFEDVRDIKKWAIFSDIRLQAIEAEVREMREKEKK